MGQPYDLLILGAGAAGLPAAIAAAEGGAGVLMIEAAADIGGSFHVSSGQMSAAGTRLQAAKGIHDTPDLHYADVMRTSRDTAHPTLLRLAVDHAAATFDWLTDLGLAVEPEHPIIHFGHEPYSVARSYWAAEGGKAVLAVLRPVVERLVRDRGLEIRTSGRLVEMVMEGGRVIGAIVERDGAHERVLADRVLIATGGYANNADLFARLTGGRPLYGGAYPYSMGDGITAAMAVGASVSGGDLFVPTFAAVPDAAAPGGYIFCTQTYPQYRQPWEIYVDLDGNRFVREDTPSVDERERALAATRDMSFWAIYDERVRREAPSFFLDGDGEAIATRFNVRPGYHRAATLADLARVIGVDPAALDRTIAAYNGALVAGEPDPLGREHRPVPLAEGPFYAVRHVGWSLCSFAGLDIDTDFRVLDDNGLPIPGLYAVGEAIGFAKTTGNGFSGGMSVTPAMTFGRLYGAAVARAMAPG